MIKLFSRTLNCKTASLLLSLHCILALVLAGPPLRSQEFGYEHSKYFRLRVRGDLDKDLLNSVNSIVAMSKELRFIVLFEIDGF